MKKLTLSLLLLLSPAIFFFGCESKVRRGQSVLLIAVENLAFENFSCQTYQEREESGFRILCEEGISFLQAFAPSVFTQASMASILTGLYPFEHGLRNNTSGYLMGELKTFPELALENSFKTAFVGSLQTIKHHSRIHQGFELYDESYLLEKKRIFRPISESVGLFLDWIKRDVGQRPYISVLQVSDALFPGYQTRDNQGDVRSQSYVSQLDEIDESLFLLFSELKRTNRWKNTIILFSGLQGSLVQHERSEGFNFNIFSERVHVPLIIKPIQTEKEETPRSWSVDYPVSLVDVGFTVLRAIDKTHQVSSGYPKVDLLSDERPERILIQEGAPVGEVSAGEVSDSSIRYSFRMKQWLWVNDSSSKIYNSLTDVNELTPLPDSDPQAQRIKDEFQKFIISEFPKWDEIRGEKRDMTLEVLHLIKQEDWKSLAKKNRILKDKKIEKFIDLISGKEEKLAFDACYRLYLSRNPNPQAEEVNRCKDRLFLSFIAYQKSSREAQARRIELLSFEYNQHRKLIELAENDDHLGGILLGNDYHEDTISSIDMILRLKAHKKILSALEANFSQPK